MNIKSDTCQYQTLRENLSLNFAYLNLKSYRLTVIETDMMRMNCWVWQAAVNTCTFWNVNICLTATYLLHLQGQGKSQKGPTRSGRQSEFRAGCFKLFCCLACSSTLKMETFPTVRCLPTEYTALLPRRLHLLHSLVTNVARIVFQLWGTASTSNIEI
jgi:hypothetical protein